MASTHSRHPRIEGCCKWIKAPRYVLDASGSRLDWRSAGKRCFKLLEFLFKPWMVALLALASFILTILYALYSKAISSDPVIGGSQNSAIRTLSAASILTTHNFLAATINASFDNLRGWLIVRRPLGYLEDLAFQSTSKTDFLKLIFGRNRKQIRPRVWSALRLVATVLPSLLNFLLMSTPHPLPFSRLLLAKPYCSRKVVQKRPIE
jgi:hypothetical protein